MEIKNYIHIDFTRGKDIVVPSIQYDSGTRWVMAKLYDNGLPIDLQELKVCIMAVKSDGKEVFNECKIIDAEKGIIEFEITKQMGILVGEVECQIKLFGPDQLLSSNIFKLAVTKTLSPSSESSKDELDVLVNALGQVQDIDNRFAQTNAQLSDIKINKMDKGGEIVVSQINKNKGKFDQTYMSDEFLQQMAGTTPINAVPADKSITPDKTTFINTGINLYNPQAINKNVFISGTGGEQSNEKYVATGFIRVTEGLPYRYNGNENICRRDLCGFYDSNKNFLGRPEELGVTEHNPFTIPQGRGICYIRLSLHNTAYAINNFYFYQGTEWLDHEQNPYGEYLDLDYVPKLTPDKIPTVTSDMIGYKAIEPSNTNFFQRQGNLIKHDDLVFGSYVVRKNGNLAKNETYCCTDFIRLEQGKYYKRRGVVGNHYAYYDENKKFVDMGGQDLPDGQFTPPQGVVYIRGSIPYGGNMESALSASIVESTYDLSEPGVDKIPYSYLKTVNEIKSEDIRQEQIKLEHLGYLEKDDTNMLNMATRVEGYYVDSDAGFLRENEKYDVSQYIAVEPNAPYITNFCRTLAFYTEDYKYISGISQNQGEVVTRFTTPSNARFLRITIYKHAINSHMLCRGTELPNKYVPYKLVMPSVIRLADEVVGPSNTTFLYETGNLIKRNEIILNHYANHSTGTPTGNTAYCCTALIRVLPGKFYSHKGIHDIHYAMFDASEKLINHSNQALGNPFQVPENVHYMRFSISWSGDESKLDNVGLSLGAVYEDNKGYLLNPDYLDLTEKVESKDIKHNQIQLEHLGFLSTTENLLNLDTRTEGYYVSWDTGNLGPNENYDVSDYLTVEPNTEYVTSHNRMMAFYDENKKYISGIENGTLPLVFTTPSNAKYLRITIYKNAINSHMLCRGTELPEEYIPYRLVMPSVIGLADEVVSPSNTTFLYETGNLIKRNEIILNHYANHSTGTPTGNTAYCCTALIRVLPGKFYSHKGIHDIHYAMFDASEKLINHSNQALGNPFQVPENVHYMRFSISWSGDESKLDNVGLSLGAVYEDNKGYLLNPDYLDLTEKVESKDIKHNQIQLEHLGFLSTTENLLNLDTRTEGYYVSWDTGNLGPNENYDVSDYLTVEPNTEYVTSHNRMMAFYDENKKYISGIENGTLPLVFTTPSNAKYLRITIYKNAINSQMLKKGNILGDYVPFGYYLPDNLIAKKVNSNNDESTTLAINLPDEIHVANNTTLEIYNRYLLNTGNPDNYFFEYSCSVGQNMKRGLVIPKGTATGRYKLTVTVYNDSLDVVCSKQVYLNVHGKGEPLSSPVKLLCIGDSITNDKPWLKELDTLSKNLYGGKAIELVGTRGGTYKHEGRSGYSSGGYVSDSSYGWQGNVKVKCPNLVVEPITKKQYNLPIGNGGTGKFEVEETIVENGVKWVYFNRLTGGGDVPKTGTATAIETSTQGDSVIEFTDVYVTSRNPFWNSTTKQVDFIHYEQNLLGTKPDVVQIYLGTNDYSSSSYIGNMKHLIDCLNRDWNVPIMVVLAPYRGNQDGMGKQEGTSRLNRKAHDVMWKQHRNILKELQGLDNVHIVPVAPCHDSEHNYGMVQGQVNSRNTSTTWYPTESVHPQECGYLQMADAMWGTLLSIILGTIG